MGVMSGIQWIDGSFVEDREARGRPPGDIDTVTLVERPKHLEDDGDWAVHLAQHAATILNKDYCKANYYCDSFYVDLGVSGASIARQAAYWFGLFSHQRDTFRWKGIVELPLGGSGIDDAASDELFRRGF